MRPCATDTRASGKISRTLAANVKILSTLLYKINTCPPRESSRIHASRISVSVSSTTYVCTGKRSVGGVCMVEISRIPERDICNVRGMGVAVIVRQSISLRICLIRSLCSTPKRCSSSRTRSPRFLNATSLERSLCVPTTKSIEPSFKPCKIVSVSLGVLKRFKEAILTPNCSNRASAVWKCCRQSTVLGHISAACLPAKTQRYTARNATSVLPKPTSPQSNRSMTLPEHISALISSIELA